MAAAVVGGLIFAAEFQADAVRPFAGRAPDDFLVQIDFRQPVTGVPGRMLGRRTPRGATMREQMVCS